MLKWRESFVYKCIVYFERNYMSSLQMFTKNFRALRAIVENTYGREIPVWFSQEYRQTMKPMNKYYNGLTINSRQFPLFVFLLLQRPELFFLFELVVLNIVFIQGIVIQVRKIKHLLALVLSKIADSSIDGEEKD